LLFIATHRSALPQTASPVAPSTLTDPSAPHITRVPNPSSSSVEHWDKLSLRDNDLHPDLPLSGQIDTFPGFTRELLRVQWRGGDPIDLYVIRPLGVAKAPVILYLYGYPAESDRYLDPQFGKTVTKDGYAAVGFVSALTGQRYHDRPMKQWFVSELQESLATSVHDVQMVLNYLSTRDDLDLTRAGIFGQGSGGTIAILTAAIDPRLKAVDVMDPWGDWPVWLAESPLIPNQERTAFQDSAFLSRVAPLDPLTWLARLDGRPLRLQEALFDLSIPETVRKHFEVAATGKATIVEYRDASEYREKVATNGRMLSWIESQLLATNTDGRKELTFTRSR
jgi:cephalosporin-C deacetylase-like acetyl esterase